MSVGPWPTGRVIDPTEAVLITAKKICQVEELNIYAMSQDWIHINNHSYIYHAAERIANKQQLY